MKVKEYCIIQTQHKTSFCYYKFSLSLVSVLMVGACVLTGHWCPHTGLHGGTTQDFVVL